MRTELSQLLLLSPLLLAIHKTASAQQILQHKLGSGTGGEFGTAAVIIGDVNGDGRDDMAVGAPYSDIYDPDGGRVDVISGADGSVIRAIYGAGGDRLGFSLCAFGADLNFDGVNDFAAGAPGADPGGLSSAGRVLVISGASGSTIATFNGAAAGDQFGYSVASAGNTSGAHRILIGAPYRNQGALSNAGAAYLYFATGGFLKEYTGTQANEHFGWSVGGAYDINSNGTLEIVVGAPDWDDTAGGLTDAGRVRVFSVVTPYSQIQTQSGGGAGYRFGAAVTMLQKWDSDIIADYAVGAPGASFGGSGSGGVQVFSGATGAILHTLSPFAAGDHAGSALASPGDVNLDGRSELVVGAPEADSGALVDAGGARLISGMTGLVLQSLFGAAAGDRLGTAVGVGGDVNDDNRNDYVLGAPKHEMSGRLQGRVYARSGVNGALIVSALGPVVGDNFGHGLANVGDIDGDGKDDYAVGAPGWDLITSLPLPLFAEDSGKVEIYSGGSGALLRTHTGFGTGANFGEIVVPVGDVNLDGRVDYAVGESQRGAAPATKGRVAIFSGLNGALLAEHFGTQDGDLFGSAISGCGDFNGDGSIDFLVGAPLYQNGPTLEAGRVEIRSALSGATLLSRNGLTTGGKLGNSVAGLMGDVSGDGLPDVVVGEPYYSSGLMGRGRVLVLSHPSNVTLTIDGSQVEAHLGFSVAGVGDVNFDGIMDFAAGSPQEDILSLVNAGSIRAFSGASGSALWTRFGASHENFGIACARLADLDRDGVSEVTGTGSPFDSGVLFAPGFVEVLSGRTGGLNVRITEGNPGDIFGKFVIALGDTDGNGFPNMAASAPYAHNPALFGGFMSVYDMRPQGLSVYGTGTAGCQGVQEMRTNGPSKIGNSNFRFHSDRVPASSIGLLLITDVQDSAGTDLFGVGIELHVGFVGAVDVYALDMFSDSWGYAVLSTPIPNHAPLVGKSYFAQSIWGWPSASCSLPPYQLSSSRGAAVTILP
ncbi:MAG: hypothetical protein JNJ88_02195 [Planctomycetes bacterium]|nr:hypothetical protein [Planctomycetota bacterium]